MNEYCLIYNKNRNYILDKSKINNISNILSKSGKSETDVICVDDFIAIQTFKIKKNNITKKISYDKNSGYFILSNCRVDNIKDIYIENPELSGLSDTDIFLRLYQKYGSRAFKKIEGPFSFVLINTNSLDIVGGRDLFGQRPMYIVNNKNHLIISSCIDVFFEMGISKKINHNKILQYIFNEHSKDSKTFYKDVDKINGGYYFTYENNKLLCKKYLNPINFTANKNYKKKEILTSFNEIFEKVIKNIVNNINTDIGTTLSGGLDSSSISLLTNKYKANKNLFSFSVHFQGLSESDFKKTNEISYVKNVISNINTNHSFINLDYRKKGPLKNPTKLFGQPYGIINGYVHESIFDACKKKEINYLMDGLFGDEIISHGTFRLNELVSRGNILIFLYELIMLRYRGIIKSLRIQLRANLISPLRKLFKKPFSIKNLRRIDLNDFSYLISENKNNKKFIEDYKKSRKYFFKSDLDEHLKLFNSGMIEFALEQLYELASQRDVECIYPFLDKRILSFSLSVPSSLKLRNGITRYYFRESLKNLFPYSLYTRYTKSNISPFANNQILQNREDIIKKIQESIYVDKYLKKDILIKKINTDKLSTADMLIIYNIIKLNEWLNIIKK